MIKIFMHLIAFFNDRNSLIFTDKVNLEFLYR